MTTPTEDDLQVYADDDFQKEYTVVDSNSDAIDVSTWVWKGEVRTGWQPDGEDVEDITVTLVNDGSDGMIQLELSATQTANLLDYDFLVYDVEYTDNNDKDKTLIRGHIDVTPDATRQ